MYDTLTRKWLNWCLLALTYFIVHPPNSIPFVQKTIYSQCLGCALMLFCTGFVWTPCNACWPINSNRLLSSLRKPRKTSSPQPPTHLPLRHHRRRHGAASRVWWLPMVVCWPRSSRFWSYQRSYLLFSSCSVWPVACSLSLSHFNLFVWIADFWIFYCCLCNIRLFKRWIVNHRHSGSPAALQFYCR